MSTDMPFDTIEIERVPDATPEQISDRLRDNRPVIFSGGAKGWDASGTWTPEYFAKRFPDFPLRLYDEAERDAIPCRFPEFIEYLNSGERLGALADTTNPLYLAWNADVISQNPTLKTAFDFRPYFGRRVGMIHTGLWMGSVGSHTRLHTDIDSYNLHTVLYGKKNFLLFAPQDEPHLYPSDVYEWSTVFSSIDFRELDLERFPKVASTTGYVGDVAEGDMIFIPIGWWHAVTCLQPTTSLNGWLFDKRLLWSRKLYRDLTKRVLHLFGLYAKGRCTCHGNPDF